MLSALISILFAIGYGVQFEPQELLTTGLIFEVDINDDGTTYITVTAPNNKWNGIGFDTSTMSSSTNAVIYTNDTSTLTDYQLSDYKLLAQELGNYWTASSVSTVGTTVTYTMSRANDISSTCSQCYTFDPSATTFNVIMALGETTELLKHQYKSPYTLQKATTAQPTLNPVTNANATDVPTTSQPTTASPSTAPATEYVTCGTASLVTDVSMTIGRKASDQTMKITITGPTDKWFAFGFGTTIMEDSYAIVTGGDPQEVTERTLAARGVGSTVGPSGTRTVTIGSSETTVTLVRPYAYSGTYDFTAFMECTVDTIDLISAIGSGLTIQHHATKGIGNLARTCSCDSTTEDPAGSAANNVFNPISISLIVGVCLYFLS